MEKVTDILTSRNNMLLLKDQRKINGNQLWIVGCSTSHGLGVSEDQRYGQLIANDLNLPVSFLTWPGSSVEWAADQILRSDICKGDTIVWGLTSLGRTPYYTEDYEYNPLYPDNVLHILARFYEGRAKFNQVIPIGQLYNKNAVYRALTKVHEVVNVCNKLKVNLIIGGLYILPQDIEYFSNITNFIDLSCTPIDYAPDKIHPGPLMHKWLAEKILKNIKEWNG